MSTAPNPDSQSATSNLRRSLGALASVVLVLGAGCASEEASTPSSTAPTTSPPSTAPPTTGAPIGYTETFEFLAGSDGWSADVADFHDATRPQEFVAEPTDASPPGMDASAGWFHIGADNPADDVFVFVKRRIDGLEPATHYQVAGEVAFASAAPSGCAGIGGAPGESVYVKIGGSQAEPMPTGDEHRLNVDKGGQSQGGQHAVVVGDVANGIPCEEALDREQRPFAMVTHSGTLPDPVTTDDQGELWVFVGADSGFEGRTDLYLDRIAVELTPTA